MSKRGEPMKTDQPSGYTGIDNLEVMTEARNYNSWLVQLILEHARSGAEVVDFGAGSGTFAEAVREAGARVTCIEPDATLRTMLSHKGFEVHADLDGVADRTFDLVYSLNVLEHIEDDAAAVRSLSRHVRPGGGIFIFVPAFPSLFTSMDRLVGHCRRYTRGSLRPLLEQAGLSVQSCRYGDSLGFFATLAYKYFGDDTGKINRGALKIYDRWVFPISRRLDVIASRVLGKNAMAYAVRR